MLVPVVLSLLSCWLSSGLESDLPPQTAQQWTRHTGLLNLALRGGYLPPPGVSPGPQRPPGQYLPPVGPQQPAGSSYPSPGPVIAVTRHSSSQQWSPVTAVTGHSQPPPGTQQTQPWIPIITTLEPRPASSGVVRQEGRPAPGPEPQTRQTYQDFNRGQIIQQSAPQQDPRPVVQNVQQAPVFLQPAHQQNYRPSPQNVQKAPAFLQSTHQNVPQAASQGNLQQAPVFLQSTRQNGPPPTSHGNIQQAPVLLQSSPPQHNRPVSQEQFKKGPVPPQPAPQVNVQSPTQEARASFTSTLQTAPAVGSGPLPQAHLEFQYLPPPQTDVQTEAKSPSEAHSAGANAEVNAPYKPPEVILPIPDVDIRSSAGGSRNASSGLPPSLSALDELRKSLPPSSNAPAVKVVSVAGQERERPLVVYFEGMHFRNKATEPGFCQSICASPSQVIEVKAGKCPPIRPGSYRGDCQDLCKYDSECPKQQRCCNVGCANVCLDPVFRKTCDDFDFQCPEGYACIDDPEKIKDAYCVNTTNKVGRCPAPELWSPSSRSCDQECSYDFQCQADERCCYNGCALVCVAPDLRKRCEDHNCAEGFTCVDDGVTDAKCISTAPRDGRCPRWTPGQYKKCGEDECQYDEQCPDGEKCCNNGCANVCVGADTRKLCSDIECPTGTACIENPTGDAQCFDTAEKDGLCPRVSNDTQPRGGCQDTCKYDSQCDDNSKCCFNGCAYVCLRPRKPDCDQIKCKVGYKCNEDRSGNPICSPIPCKQDGEIIDIECNSCTCIQGYLLCSQEECPPVKPGFCPKITKGYKGKCVEDCDSDYNCDGEHKCCSTGCGHTCQKPVSEIVHPCKTVRFRCGDATRCAATRGLCQPGKTCPLSPLCVSTRAPFCESCPPGKVCVLQKRSCPNGGSCHRQPICIQLYSDDTIFEEDEELEQVVVAKQTAGRKTG